jgi:hypothetical protein
MMSEEDVPRNPVKGIIIGILLAAPFWLAVCVLAIVLFGK